MDVARVLRRLGAEVTVLYRRTAAEMPAIAEEAAAAARDGVRFEFLSLAPGRRPRKAGRCASPWSACAWASPTPRAGPVPSPPARPQDLVFDAVFKAIGERADLAPFPDALREKPGGWLAVGAGGATADPAVFVAGDLATGPATVVAAIARGPGGGRRGQRPPGRRLRPARLGPARKAPRWWAAAR